MSMNRSDSVDGFHTLLRSNYELRLFDRSFADSTLHIAAEGHKSNNDIQVGKT